MTFTATDIAFGRAASRVPDETRILDDVQLMDLPDPDYLIDGILARGGICAIWGPPGGFKTTLVADMLVSIATGQDWFSHPVRHRGASLYVGAEDVAGFKVRLAAKKRAAGLSLSAVVGVYTFPEAIDLRDPVSVSGFIRFVQAQGGAFVLVVVDTYAAATPGAVENSSEDTTAAMAAAQRIREALNVTVLLIHHSNAAGTRERGHSAMRGAVDTMIQLNPVDDVVHVVCDKQRNGSPFSTLTLKPVPAPEGGLVLRLAADVLPSTELTTLQVQVLDALRDIAGRDGATKTSWRQACASISERSFYKIANLLEKRRLIVKIGSSHFRPGDAV